jgi:U-box domain
MPSPPRSLPLRGSPPSNLLPLKEEEDAALFEAPSELVCPITHAVFLDPVLTQAGHVSVRTFETNSIPTHLAFNVNLSQFSNNLQAYERKAIEQHLRNTDTDPMSRQPLLNPSLTPVFVIKSRAIEYRESTSRQCVDRACSSFPPRPPIDYLRRAVELCSDAGFLPKGLTSEVVSYVNSHLSNVYDRLALDLFAQGLYSYGYRDRAAAVYFHLLVSEEDKTAQADMLKRCLACWQAGGTTPNENNIIENTISGGGTGGGGTSTNVSKDLDSHVFEKLIQMIDNTSSFGWLIEVSSEAGLGNTFIARLCQHILFPSQRGVTFSSTSLLSSSLSSSSSGFSLSGPILRGKKQGKLPWETEKEVLLKYCFVLTSGIEEEQAEMNKKIKILEDKVLFNSGGGRRGNRGVRLRGKLNRMLSNASSFSNGDDFESDGEEHGGSGNNNNSGDFVHPITHALMFLKRVVRHPFVMVPCAAVAVLGDPHSPLVRSTFVVPFLALMQNFEGGSGSHSSGGGGGRFSSSSLAMPHSPSIAEAEAVRNKNFSSNGTSSSDGGSHTLSKKESE